MKKIQFLALFACFLLLSLPLVACQSEETSVKISVGSVTAESDVVCSEILLDDSWVIRAGSLTGGFLETPPRPRSSTAISPAMPMPAKYTLDWVHRQTRTVFRVDTYAPELVAKAEEMVRRHGAASFRKELIIVLRDSGEVQVWLDIYDRPYYEQRFIEFIGSFQGKEGTNEHSRQPDESRHLSTPVPEKGA